MSHDYEGLALKKGKNLFYLYCYHKHGVHDYFFKKKGKKYLLLMLLRFLMCPKMWQKVIHKTFFNMKNCLFTLLTCEKITFHRYETFRGENFKNSWVSF